MFHDLLDYTDSDFHKIYKRYNVDHIRELFKNCKLDNNYFGKGHYLVDEYNRKKEEEEFETKFRNTKNKIKLVVYRNGFILNNGEFRHRALKENHEFLKSVEKGNIPQEFIRKGITDLGILLINRRDEMYVSKLYHSLPASFDYINLSKNSTQNSTHVLDKFFQKNVQNKNDRGSLYNTTTERVPRRFRLSEIEKRANSLPKDSGTKLFVPFSGNGKLLATSNIEGLHVEKNVANYYDDLSPVCTINIRLFNGENIKETFNCNQTLRDIYLYVRRITGSNNFVLLDGFPPKPITNYEKTIEELNLQNTLLIQQIQN